MFLPIKDINPTVNFPYMTITLIATNVVVFLYELTLGPDLGAFVAAYGATPYELSHGVDLVGRYYGLPLIHQAGPPIIYMTIFSSMFIHGSFLHIFGNMLYLWIFGNNIEDLLGPFKFLFFYIACGVIAAFAHTIVQFNSPIPTVGASGAVAGILGAYLIAYPRARVLTLVFIIFFIRLVELPAAFILFFWFILQAFSGMSSLGAGINQGGVAWFAHIGGFLTDIVLIKAMAREKLKWLRAADRRY